MTRAWFFIFVSVPIYAGAFLWRFRRLAVAALLLAGYGVGLVVAPETVTGFWPWPIDGFHGRVYSATFLSLALASVLVARAASSLGQATLGVTCVVLGALQPLGLLAVDADVDKVDWAAPGTWAWTAMFGALLAYGLVLAGVSLRRESAVPRAVTA